MKIATYPELKSAILFAEKAYASMKEIGRDDIAVQIGTMIKAATDQKFLVGIVGSAKRGKSTLINGLLGRTDDKLAPIGRFPTTNVISIFRRAEKASINVFFNDEKRAPIKISEDEVRLYACEDKNPDNKKNVRSIEVEGPFPGLEANVYIADTPGAHNALSAIHGDILLNFLPHADALIFLVTAGEPLVKAESELLQDIQEKDIRKIFFAINKVDSVDSDELAEGIEYNRDILDQIGLKDIKIYTISAKNYFEERNDVGTEDLLNAISETIKDDRIKIIVERINKRTMVLLDQVKIELAQDLELANTTDADLINERAKIENIKRGLQQGRETRERDFVMEWDKAFSELNKNVNDARKNLKEEFGQVVDKTSGVKINALAQTIHGSIAASFSKEISAAIMLCEKRIDQAQKNFVNAVQTTVISINPCVSSDSTIRSDLGGALKVGAATIPGIVTGAISSSLPGLIGSAMLGVAPAVTVATWNPLTWIAAAGTGAANAAVATGSAALTGILTAVATPFALAAFGYAAYRGYSTWKEQKDLDKHKLKIAVDRMIDAGCTSVLEQVEKYKEQIKDLLNKINKDLDQKLADADAHLEELTRNRPSPEKIAAIDRNLKNIEEQVLLLVAPKDESEEKGLLTRSMSEELFK